MANDNQIPVCTTLAEGLAFGVTSTGRRLGIINTPTHGLWRIAYIDGKGGALPERLQGRYTGTRFAQEDLDAFVTATWNIVTEKIEESKARKAKVKKSEPEQPAVAA